MHYTLRPFRYIMACLAIVFSSLSLSAQDRCGTMDLLQKKFTEQPNLKIMFDQREAQLRQIIDARARLGKSLRTNAQITIPVVFHVVLSNQSLVTDRQIMAQLDTINKDYAGLNGSSNKIPASFQAVYGQSEIQFCLAQRTPDNAPSTGIVRHQTSRASFDFSNNLVKHAETGGADAWDPDSYLNIWICDLTGTTLGYATFPDDGVEDEQGVAVDYASLPGGSAAGFNYGKTLTHELGHYFNLYHIWGDDGTACSGSDGVADTPNQGGSTTSCRTGVVTDNCAQASPGIMYQNYMDYTPDACLFMFTALQVERMRDAINRYRSSLTLSNGCTPVDLKTKDASLGSISQPEQRICTNTLAPRFTLVNKGIETLTSLNIHAIIDNGTIMDFRWTGSLATFSETLVTLPSMTTDEGNHVLRIYVTDPNGGADEDPSNDTVSLPFIYYEPFAAPVTEGFESLFLPQGWDIVNEDGGSTWEKTSQASKSGAYSVRISNYDNQSIGQFDYLRSPTVNIAGADSAFVSFQVAAATYHNTTAQGNVWDTLQVMISTDCGRTYTSVYKKWGASLVTREAATRSAFTPSVNEWRREQINIGRFINQGEILVAFRNTNGNENDIFLDDINIRTVVINPNLKEAGFLVSPNPTNGLVSVQFYPHPTGLKSVSIYNVLGQKVAERVIAGEVGTNVYDFELANNAAGLYIIKAEFSNRVLTKKIVKN